MGRCLETRSGGEGAGLAGVQRQVERVQGGQVFRDQEGWRGCWVGKCSETRRGGEGAGWAGVQRPGGVDLHERLHGD